MFKLADLRKIAVATCYATSIMNQHAKCTDLIHMLAGDFDIVDGCGSVEYLVSENRGRTSG